MIDLIDREAILKDIEKIRQSVQMMDDTHRASITMNGVWLCEKAVRNQPSAQPKKGSWEHCEDEDGMYDVCSNCGADVDISHYGQSYCYCPHCGAEQKVRKYETCKSTSKGFLQNLWDSAI